MSCCADPRASLTGQAGTLPSAFADAVERKDDTERLVLAVPGIHCAACISRIEDALARHDGLTARVNFTRRTVALSWPAGSYEPGRALSTLRDLGYAPQPAVSPVADDGREETRTLLRALAVAGFAAMNVMLLSVSVWAGADGTTEHILSWFAALVALPALAYAARPFVRSALISLRGGRLNMDVPISLAIILAAALSLAKTITGEGETYFDAAVTLTFFLLAARTLDQLTRARARSALTALAAMAPRTANIVTAEGAERVPLQAVRPGDTVLLAAGERVPVDAVLKEAATFDEALATGESRPVHRAAGESVLAGALAISGPVHLTASAPAADSFLARLAALQSAAESARSRPALIADRAARIYAPVVHLLAAVTLAAWMMAGASWMDALTIAIAVLIITCPCALGLAVPVVHVAACDRLFRQGLAVKDGAALERLRTITKVVFDKTGTLTVPTLDFLRAAARR